MEHHKQLELLAAISKVQSAFIIESNTTQAFQALLNTLLELTCSEYGFIGEILTTETGAPYLKTHAITNIAWDQVTEDLYQKNAPSLQFYNLKTLFGHVITSGRPVISNFPDKDPRRGGLPKGHPPMTSFLGIPLHFFDQLIGMVGVANRPEGYHEDLLDFLAPFLKTCSVLLKAVCIAEEKRNAQQQREDQTARLQAILNQAVDGIITIDPRGRIESYNQAAEHLFGYPTREAIGQHVEILIAKQHLTENGFWNRIEQKITGLRKDGTTFLAGLSLSKITGADQVLYTGIVRDLTTQEQAAATLSLSEEHLRDAQALAHMGSWVWSIESGQQTWSDELYRICGFNPRSFDPTFEAFTQSVHPEDKDKVLATIRTALQHHDFFQLEFRIQRPSGGIRHILGRGVIDRDTSRRAFLSRAIFLDITEEWQAKHDRAILTYAVDHGMEGLALLNRDGRFIYMNPAHAEMYGFTADELIGKTWRELYGEEEIARIESAIFPHLGQHGSWSGEAVGRRKTSESFDVELSLRLLSGSMATGPEFLVCTCRDITTRKQAEDAVRRSHESLERRVQERTIELKTANKLLRSLPRQLIRTQEAERRRIARDLHDEIGQALTALNINLQILQAEDYGRATIEESLHLSTHLLQQVRNLAGELRPQLLDELGLEEALRIYIERQAERNGWKTSFQIVGRWQTCSDEVATTCFRIVQESLTNAARHARASVVTISARFDQTTVALVIQDNGVGFCRPVSQQMYVGGTSGLKGMHERVTLTGGMLTVESSPGNGTRIHTEIPLLQDPGKGDL